MINNLFYKKKKNYITLVKIFVFIFLLIGSVKIKVNLSYAETCVDTDGDYICQGSRPICGSDDTCSSIKWFQSGLCPPEGSDGYQAPKWIPQLCDTNCDGERPNICDCSCGDWGAWGACSNDCGTGIQYRYRSCTPDACDDESDSQSCTVYNNINGGWDDWTTCSSCSQSRDCDDPAPYCNGLQCLKEDGTRGLTETRHCGTVNGGWTAWSECNSSGNQTRTCSSPAPLCGGTECTLENGTTGLTETRPCGKVIGVIWNDTDYSNDYTYDSPNEDWSKSPSLCTTKLNTFSMTSSNSDPGDILNSTLGAWGCNGSSDQQSYFSTTQQLQRGTRTITLSGLPTGYQCGSNNVWWSFSTYNGTGWSTPVTGNGCSATVPILAAEGSNSNHLHWRIRPDCEVQNIYDLRVNVNEAPHSAAPNCNGDTAPDGLEVTITSTNYPSIVRTDTINDGYVDFNSISAGTFSTPRISVGSFLVDGEVIHVYTQECPSVGTGSFTAFEDDPARYCQDRSTTVGVQRTYKEPWVSAVDSDVFAGSVNVYVPLGIGSAPSGFVKALLNSYDNVTGGFVFSKGDIDRPSEQTGSPLGDLNLLFEGSLGGRATNLDSGTISHNSKWLESFTFKAPFAAKEWTLTGSEARFIPGEIYYVENSYLQAFLNFGSEYKLSSGVSVLYVTGDITVKKPIQTPDIGRLLLIVDGSVTIDSDVGTTTLAISEDPQIEAGIIAKDGIAFESEETVDDKPIMVSAPLISRTSIIFERDLGYDKNATMPAESAKSFNKFLYLLSSLERLKSENTLYYTGVTTFDLDWEYIY